MLPAWVPLLFAITTPPSPGYVGSRACSACHQQIYKEYVRTAMGRSMSLPGNQLPAGTEPIGIESLQREFRVFRKDGEIYQSESQPGVFENAQKLAYAIGSGENGISFAVRRGPYLFQAPLSYYSRTASWNLSPGFERADEGFSRPIYDACIVCHSGRPQAVPGRDGLFDEPPFAELAIGCENCHGPGAAHIAAKSKGRTIVNPARLSARLAEDICMVPPGWRRARAVARPKLWRLPPR